MLRRNDIAQSSLMTSLIVAINGLLAPEALTVEYLAAPLGVDEARPLFGFQFVHPRRGISVAGFDLQVATDASFSSVIWDVHAKSRPLIYGGDAPLQADTQYFWRVRPRHDNLNDTRTSWAVSTFRMGLLSRSDWHASWITGGHEKTLLRREFVVSDHQLRPASQYVLYVSGIGYSSVSINGVQVSDQKLSPGWSDFQKRVLYATFEVSSLIRNGTNAIGVSLGNGWWSCGPPPGTRLPHCSPSPPQLLLQLNRDGRPHLVSDQSWQVAEGPISYNSLYNGEHYDARRAFELRGWDHPGFDPSNSAEWVSAASAAGSAASQAKLSSALFEPTRHLATFPPRAITSPAAGVQVFDFGQNMAGVVRLRGIVCASGQQVTLRHAELLRHPPYGPRDGSIYVGNLRTAAATDVYTCRGSPGGEDYTPTFTQHGFRFVEVSGLHQPLAEDQISAIEMHADLPSRSQLTFGGAHQWTLNGIVHMVQWSQKSNVMSGVPTDCPNRDERRGWTGDTALTAEEAVHSYGMGAVYSRWLRQFEDDQLASGASNDFVPSLGDGENGSPNWQSAFPTLVWVLLTYHGDARPAELYHEPLSRYFDQLEARYNRTGVRGFHQGNSYGDWVPPGGNAHRPPANLVGSFAMLHDLTMGAEFFSASAHPAAAARAEQCQALFKRVAAEFNAHFLDAANGYYGSGMQTEQALPLYLGIVPTVHKPRVLAQLVNDIVTTHSYHTTSGIIGIKAVLEALTAESRTDVALGLLQQTTYPSYGFMLAGGAHGYEPATTLWELWESDTSGPAMNSRNHIMFGSPLGWMYKRALGVTPLLPGYAKLAVRPAAIGVRNLTTASGRVGTPHGEVLVSWDAAASGRWLSLNVTVPLAPRPSTVRVPRLPGGPAADAVTISESGRTIWRRGTFIAGVDGIKAAHSTQEGDSVEFELLAGRFAFRSSA